MFLQFFIILPYLSDIRSLIEKFIPVTKKSFFFFTTRDKRIIIKIVKKRKKKKSDKNCGGKGSKSSSE